MNTTAVETETKLVVRSPNITSAVACVLQGAPFIAVIGPDAATSSAAASVLKSELEQAPLRVLSVRRGESDGLRLTGIAAQLLDKPEAAFDPDDIERLFEILTDPAGSGQPIVLVIDGAEALQQDVINYLRLLSTLASHAAPRIVFVGQPGLWQAVAALKDLIAAHWILSPEDEAALRQPAEPLKTLDALPAAARSIRAAANDVAEPSRHPIPPLDRVPPVLSQPAAAPDVKPTERPKVAPDLNPPERLKVAPALKSPERPAATSELTAPERPKVDSALKVSAEPIATSGMKLPAQRARETKAPGPQLPSPAPASTLRVPAGKDSAPARPIIKPISEPIAAELVPAAAVRRRGPRYAAVLIGSALIFYGAAEAAKRLDVFYGAAEAIKRLDVFYSATEAVKRLDLPTAIHGLVATVYPSRPVRVAVTPQLAPAPAPQADARPPVASPAVQPEPATTPPVALPKAAAPAPSLAPIAQPKVTAAAPSVAPAPPVAPPPPAAHASAEDLQPPPATPPTNLTSAPIGAPAQIPVPAPAIAPTAVRSSLGDLAPATTVPLPASVSVHPPGLAEAPEAPAQATQQADAPARTEAPSHGPVVTAPNIAAASAPPAQSAAVVVAEPLGPLSRATTFTLVSPPHATPTAHAAPPQAAAPPATAPPATTAQAEAPQPAVLPPASPQSAIPETAAPQTATPPAPTAQVEAAQPAGLLPASRQAAAPQAITQPAIALTQPPASVPPAVAAAQPTATAVKLAPPDVRALIARGDSLLALGDIAAARLLYERAASLGSGRAATAVGRTYDPEELAQLHVNGPKPDKSLAASWYRSGATLGDTEATGMLRRLNGGEPAK